MRLLKIIFLFILLIPFASAKTGHMKLLTVGGVNETGGVADLLLEVKPGTGRIFIDSFPLTKLDTQISTRFANEIACDFLDENCNRYDFFYTIRAGATIVGGPSAGAAMAVLTVSVLDDLEMDEETIMTGTINSGGLIGPVAGIDLKVNAAIDEGFTKILLPKWQSTVNISKIEEKGLDEKITIVKVKNLEEALYYFTGKDFSKKDYELLVSEDYNKKMKEVADLLCQRSEDIIINVEKTDESLYISAEDHLNRSIEAAMKEDSYSRASYCFSANLRLREIEFSNKTSEELQLILEETLYQWKIMDATINNTVLQTLSDLETYMVVKERLSESKAYLDEIDEKNISYETLAYAKERLFSAVSWAKFFELDGIKIQLDESHLMNVCLKKTAEAEERISYAKLYLPTLLEGAEEEISLALKEYNQGEYALCIFKASKAKAKADIILTALTIHEDEMEMVLQEKFEAIKRVIVEQNAKGMFPILGYSYFEYSKSLIEYDPISSMTFAEYALEFSKLDMYFPKENQASIHIEPLHIQLFSFGLIAGAALIMLICLRRKK
ncbi:MAG: S16 family serine protease [archaeon]